MHMKGVMLDKWFVGLLSALIIVGLVMLTSATLPVGFERYHDSYYFLKSHILKGLLPGFIFAVIAYYLTPYLMKISPTAWFGIVLGLLTLVFIPGLEAPYGTTRSWIYLGGFGAQPAEFAKLAFIFAVSLSLARKTFEERRHLHQGLLPFVIMVSLVAGLLIAQPDTGTLMIFGAIAIAIYTTLGLSLKHFSYLVLAGATGLGALIASASYRLARFMTFLHPGGDVLGKGYQLNQALLGLGSGGIFGLGLGHSRQKFLYLPEVSSDSIFAVIGEELGFVMSCGLIVIIILITLRGLKLADRVSHEGASAVMIGILSWFFIQSVINIASIIGLIPLTGVPLPFVSHGGSATMALLTAWGVFLRLSQDDLQTV